VNTTDWIAIVGAAAWLPQALGWIMRRVTRPLVRIVPHHSPEIGFTSFGPIFNLTCAISADRKDAVIERMTASLAHERGQKLELVWSTLNETISQIRSPSGTAEVGKNQPAIALKVSTLVLAEKAIGFQDRAFRDEVEQQTGIVAERMSFLQKSNSDPGGETLKSKEFADLVEIWERRFCWQEGRYAASIGIRIAGVKKPTVRVLSFRLSQTDVERLRRNVPEVRRWENDLVIPPPEPTTYTWNWVYPTFS
jgi:hypothetical protein